MNSFLLKMITPDGLLFDGPAQQLTVRAVTGDLGILAGHADLVTPLGKGRVTVVDGDRKRNAACNGGILSVLDGTVTLMSTDFQFCRGES